jgi:hypothetical protein
MIPSQIEYLAQTGAREGQQAQRSCGVGTNIGDAIFAFSCVWRRRAHLLRDDIRR